MELINITPYVRFANMLCFEQLRGPSKTYDCRFLYTFSGSATLIMMGQEYTLQKGALAIFQSNTEYVIHPNSSLTLAVFDFDYTQDYHDTSDYLAPCSPDMFRQENVHEQILFNDAPVLNRPFYHPNVSFLEHEISEIISEFQVKKIFFREKNSTQFKNLLINLIRHQQLGNINNDVVRQVVEYIDRHPTGRISNAQIGLELNFEIRTRGLLNPIREVIPKSSAIYTNHAKVAVFTGPYVGAILSIFHKMLIFCIASMRQNRTALTEVYALSRFQKCLFSNLSGGYQKNKHPRSKRTRMCSPNFIFDRSYTRESLSHYTLMFSKINPKINLDC